MDTHIRIEPIERYYDMHPDEIEGVELSQIPIHSLLVNYLIEVLNGNFREEDMTALNEINLYINEGKPTPKMGESRARRGKRPQPSVPDIIVIRGWSEAEVQELSSYAVNEDGPAPLVVFEIASKDTWLNDLRGKRDFYLKARVAEYFVYDPHTPQVWRDEWREKGRLVGWRLDESANSYIEIARETGKPGELWSEQLQSWLKSDGYKLRLYDKYGQKRLTGEEAERQQKLQAQARVERIEAELETEHNRAEIEYRRAEQAVNELEAERNRAEAERIRAEKLAELLRQHGFNPDDSI